MRILLKLGGTVLVAYAVSAAMALMSWGISYGIRGVPVVHDGVTLVGTLVVSVIVATAFGSTMIAAAGDMKAKEEGGE